MSVHSTTNPFAPRIRSPASSPQERETLRRPRPPLLAVDPLDLGQIRLFEVRLGEVSRDRLSRPGDGADFQAFQAAEAGGDPVAVAEGGEFGVGEQGGEDPAAGLGEEVFGSAVEAEAPPMDQQDARGCGFDVAGDVGREKDDAIRRLFEQDLAKPAARFDVEPSRRLVDDQNRRRAEEAAGDPHALPHAAREIAHLAGRVLGEADRGEEFADLCRFSRARQAPAWRLWARRIPARPCRYKRQAGAWRAREASLP